MRSVISSPAVTKTLTPTAAAVRAALKKSASPERAAVSQTFFKTGKGQYGEGDVFMGVTVPNQRIVARLFTQLPANELLKLLHSKIHEERLTALLILVRQYERSSTEQQAAIVKLYLDNTAQINNWDLVDGSAPYILGHWLLDKDRKLLCKLAKSKLLWERRIAMIATYSFIRNGEHEDCFAIAKLLLKDEHDLMHKAVGWMLREVGKRVGVKQLRSFLSSHATTMPRTALRYAIEHMNAEERATWMKRV
jgi:3-methyladenine DNA glycosylase AlkD